MSEFNKIKNRNELADFLKIPTKKFTYILYKKKVENLYTTFEISKKSGGVRIINTPHKDLKDIQKKLSEVLWKHQQWIWNKNQTKPNISHAFEKRKSIITNAKIHRRKRYILNIDLNDFFNSFHFGRVRGFFEKNKHFELPREVSTVIAQIACYEGRLPQGAPSSPIITNLICSILDMRILKIAKRYKIDYTRYVDDLTFSTNNKRFLDNYDQFVSEISTEIENAGFSINNSKTRLLFRDSRQEVTGLVVNEKVNVNRDYYKSNRAMANQLYKTGDYEINGESGTLNQLEGRFSFINQLDRYNNKLDNDRCGRNNHKFEFLNSREKQYQKFLFYKYFFSNPKPLLVTEGKTDIIYLKAALKKMHTRYPKLITKNSKSEFEYRISFLKKTKRLKYFLNIQLDGASSMKNIYKFFSNKENKKYPNYLDEIQKISNTTPGKPVILVFDNELGKKEKPICDFLNYVGKNKKDDIEVLMKNLQIKIVQNLYLLTNPAEDSKPDCEIEQLFDEETLSHEIYGKKLNLNNKFDTSDYYGKEIFSKYVYSNYEKINFDNFIPMLDALNEVINDYKMIT